MYYVSTTSYLYHNYISRVPDIRALLSYAPPMLLLCSSYATVSPPWWLQAMGFSDRALVSSALKVSDNDMSTAVEKLFQANSADLG